MINLVLYIFGFTNIIHEKINLYHIFHPDVVRQIWSIYDTTYRQRKGYPFFPCRKEFYFINRYIEYIMTEYLNLKTCIIRIIPKFTVNDFQMAFGANLDYNILFDKIDIRMLMIENDKHESFTHS